MGGQPQQQQRELTNLGQSAVPSQLSGATGGILGGMLPQQQQEYQQMNTITPPNPMQPQLPTEFPREQQQGLLGSGQPQGMALFSPLNQFLLANSGNNPLLNNIAGMMGMPNRSGSF
jgi:hypothetical protein